MLGLNLTIMYVENIDIVTEGELVDSLIITDKTTPRGLTTDTFVLLNYPAMFKPRVHAFVIFASCQITGPTFVENEVFLSVTDSTYIDRCLSGKTRALLKCTSLSIILVH